MIQLDLSILNQKGTPMFNSDLTANRPSPAVVGRIFIATDSPYGIFRDTGTAWEQIAGSGGGGGNTIYTANDTLTGNRVVSSGGFSLTFNPSTTFATTLTAPTGSGAISAIGVNTLSYTAGFSSSNLGNVYAAIGGINLQTFAGSATFAQANLAAANVSVNSVDFSSAGSTITMTQATGLRVMAGHQNQFQYQGTNSGTITHAATSQNLGFYRPPGATGILTITNAYGHLINDLNDYGAGFIFTNRWGIYQAGTNDTNYLASSLLIGTTVNAGFKLDIANGNARINGVVVGRGNSSSDQNTCVGRDSGIGTMTGIQNTSLGFRSGRFITTGSFNTSIGVQANPNGTIGDFNTCVGYSAANSLSAGSGNTLLGAYSGNSNDGSGNVMLGIGAGFNQTSVSNRFFLSNGIYGSAALDLTNSMFYGVFSTNLNNQILRINARTGIGLSADPVASAQFQIDSNTRGFLKPRMTNAQVLAIASPDAGLEVYNTDLNEPCFYNGSSWRKINNSPM